MGWCSKTRALGSAWRLPLVPPANSTAPILDAWPMQIVEMSAATYCMVS